MRNASAKQCWATPLASSIPSFSIIGRVPAFAETQEGIPAKISVIIPTFSRADMCSRAPSIPCSPTSRGVGWEVVVVNDNPPSSPERERTREAVQAIGTRAWRMKNSAACLSRNQAFSPPAARTSSFLDDDDYYRPGKLQRTIPLSRRAAALIFFVYGLRNPRRAWTHARSAHAPPAGNAGSGNAPARAPAFAAHPTMTYMFRRRRF